METEKKKYRKGWNKLKIKGIKRKKETKQPTNKGVMK